jgi:hypothetical protein
MDLHNFLCIYGRTSIPRLAAACGSTSPAFWQVISGKRGISYSLAKRVADVHEHFDVLTLMESHRKGVTPPSDAAAMRRAKRAMEEHGIPGSPAGRMGPARALDLRAGVVNDRAKALHKPRVLSRPSV